MDPAPELPSVEDLRTVADFDEFTRMVNAAITWMTDRGHHEIVVAGDLKQHAAAVLAGRRLLHHMMDQIVLRHVDQRDALEARLREAGVLSRTRPVYKRIFEAKQAAQEQALDEKHAAGIKRTEEDEGRLLLRACDDLHRLSRLGFVSITKPQDPTE